MENMNIKVPHSSYNVGEYTVYVDNPGIAYREDIYDCDGEDVFALFEHDFDRPLAEVATWAYQLGLRNGQKMGEESARFKIRKSLGL